MDYTCTHGHEFSSTRAVDRCYGTILPGGTPCNGRLTATGPGSKAENERLRALYERKRAIYERLSKGRVG